MLARIALLLLLTTGGCTHTRWALRDRDYARKYPKAGDDPLEQVKQSLDARHLRRKDGWFAASGSSQDGQAVSLDAGRLYYSEAWKEHYLAFSGLYSDDLHDAFLGGKLGTRIQSPSRLAPFAGVGGFAGLFHKGSAHDALWLALQEDCDDHDSCCRHDDCENSRWDPGDDGLHPLFAICPEAGVHYWLDSDTRVSASVSYLISTEGRDYDYLLLGLSLARLKLDPRPNEYLDLPPAPESPDAWESSPESASNAAAFLTDE